VSGSLIWLRFVWVLPVWLFIYGVPDFDDLWYTYDKTPPIVSAAEPGCGRLWLEGARNDPWLRCLLKTSPKRLCRPEEREHLAWALRRYEASRIEFDRRLWSYLVQSRRNLAKDDSEDKPMTEKFNAAMRKAANELMAVDGFAEAVKMESLADSDLSDMLRRLAEQGLVDADDIRGGMPEWVAEAFEDLQPRRVCLS
jgi:hypothetical protein